MARWPYTKGLHDLGNGSYAYLQPDGGWGWSNEQVASWMSVLFLAGAVLAIIAPETKSQELPE